MKIFNTLSFLFGILACAANANAGTLYAATSAGGPGELYVINQATGAMVQDVGPLNDSLSTNYPITGLAFSPLTGVLYGSTGNAGTVDGILVKINPATAIVTVVGAFNAGPVNSGGSPATMADIAFDSAGIFMGLLRLAALIFIRSIRRPPRRRLSALTVCRHPLLAAAWQSARAAYLTLHQHPRVSEPIT